MYSVINTADSEVPPATPASTDPPANKKRTRSATKVNGGGSTSNSAADQGTTSTNNTDDVSEGFTPTWREESDARVERRRDIIVNYTGGTNSATTSQTTRGPYGSVGENSGTNLIDEEEEEREFQFIGLKNYLITMFNNNNIILQEVSSWVLETSYSTASLSAKLRHTGTGTLLWLVSLQF